jgi:hypothetical protein
VDGGGYCPAHAHLAQQGERQQTPAQRRFYNSGFWKRLRAVVRAQEPLCRLCLDAGRATPTQLVDHIDGDWRNNDRSNLRGLCLECHTALSAHQHSAKSRRG